jgi:aquaporin Z
VDQLWLFWIAPIIGAVVAGVLYPLIAESRGGNAQKLALD